MIPSLYEDISEEQIIEILQVLLKKSYFETTLSEAAKELAENKLFKLVDVLSKRKGDKVWIQEVNKILKKMPEFKPYKELHKQFMSFSIELMDNKKNLEGVTGDREIQAK